MSNVLMTSRWAAQVVGHSYDIENLTHKLNNSIVDEDDLFVSFIGYSTCLRCRKWDGVTDALMLYEIATKDLSVIRGLMDCLDGCAYLKIGTVFELDHDSFIISRHRKTGLEAIILPEESARADPTQLRNMIHIAEAVEAFKIAVAEFDAFPGWYSIYKALEACLKVWDGPSGYVAHDASAGRIIERTKQTANWHRHASITYPYPKKPVTKEEAVSSTKKLIVETSEKLAIEHVARSGNGEAYIIPENRHLGEHVAIRPRQYGRGFEVGVVGKEVNWVPVELPEDD